jgi:hypothetical protein
VTRACLPFAVAGQVAERLLELVVRHWVETGEYVLDEVFEDGRIVLRPDTSKAAIRERAGLDPVTHDEFEQAFGHLPSDSEG